MRVFAWVNLCGLDCDLGNPPLVGGFDVDRKWIITGSGLSPEMKLSCDNLIHWKNAVVENVERSLEHGRGERIVGMMYGSERCPELNTCLY